MGRTRILKTIAAFSAVIFPVLARAEEGLFTPPEGDLFMAMLSQVVGKLLKAAGWESDGTGVYAGITGDPLHTTLELISTVGVGFALSLVAFSMLSTLIHSSQTGKTFIQDLGGAFYVGRTVTILFLLVPFWNGLGLGMILLTWAFSKMVGFGGTEWKSFLGMQEKFIKTETKNDNIKSLYAIKVPRPEVSELVYRVFEGYVCMYGAASQQLYNNEQKKRQQDIAQIQQNDEGNRSLVENNDSANSDRVFFDKKNDKATNVEIGSDKNDSESEGNLYGDTGDKITDQSQDKDIVSTSAKADAVDDRKKWAGANGKSSEIANKIRDKYIEARKEVISGEKSIDKNNYPKDKVGISDVTSIKNTAKLDKAYEDLTHVGSRGNSQTHGSARTVSMPKSGKAHAIAQSKLLAFGYENRGDSDLRESACGFVNFGSEFAPSENNIAARADRIRNDGNGYISNAPGNNNKNTIGQLFVGTETILSMQEESRNREKKRLQLDKPVLAIYAELFDGSGKNGYAAQIQMLAKQYVEAINTHSRTDFKVIEGMMRPVTSRVVGDVFDKNKRALQKGVAHELDKIAGKLEQDVLKEIRTGLDKKAKESRDANSAKEANNYIDILQKAQNDAEQQGFFSMFKFMTALQNDIATVQNLTRTVPEFSNSAGKSSDAAFTRLARNDSGAIGLKNIPLKKVIGKAYGYMDQFTRFSQSKSLRAKYDNVDVSKANPLMELAYGADIRNLTDGYRHPMVMTVEAGHTMLNAIELYTNSSHIAAQSNSGSNGGARTSTSAGNAVNALVSSMYAMGMMLAYFIPAMPLLYGIGAVLGITVNFFTILFSLPFVLAMHLTPEGSKYAGKAAQAYPQIVSMLLAIPSLAFGFILAMVLLQVFGILAITAFADGMDLIYSSNYSPVSHSGAEREGYFHLNSLTASFAVFVLFSYLLYQLNIRALSIMTLAADKIPTMIGGAMGQLTEAAQAIGGSVIENKVESKASAIGQGASAYQQNSGSGGSGSGGVVSGGKAAAPITAGGSPNITAGGNPNKTASLKNDSRPMVGNVSHAGNDAGGSVAEQNRVPEVQVVPAKNNTTETVKVTKPAADKNQRPG